MQRTDLTSAELKAEIQKTQKWGKLEGRYTENMVLHSTM